MSQVWEHSRHQSGALLVLLALADFAGADDGSRIFPGIDRLAHKARLSRRQTEKILAELLNNAQPEEAKFLARFPAGTVFAFGIPVVFATGVVFMARNG